MKRSASCEGWRKRAVQDRAGFDATTSLVAANDLPYQKRHPSPRRWRSTIDVAPANDVVGLAPVDPLVNTGDHHRRGHPDRRPDFTAVVDDHQPQSGFTS